jgi:hypothetical protein
MKRVTAIFLIFIFVASFSGCAREDEQTKVKKIITAIQAASEAKEVKKVMEHISKNYSDPLGNNNESIRGLLVGYFSRYPKISAYISNLDISVEGAAAKAKFETVLTSGVKTGSISDVIPESLGVWNFDVTLKKESDAWKVISAQWQKALI